jgi:lycopene cyclase domain-containing protein
MAPLAYLISLLFSLPAIAYAIRSGWLRPILKTALLLTPPGLVWDWVMTSYLGVWIFNEGEVMGIWLFGLPLEEYLFFVVVTMAVSSVALAMGKKVILGHSDPILATAHIR